MLLTIKEVMELTGIKQSTVYKYMKQKGFPKPIKFSSKAVRWRKEDVINWINSFK